MAETDAFRLSVAAAETYESLKVPSVFGPLAKATLDAVSLPPNASVIDIACGTGIVSRHVTHCLQGRGRIVGTDLNPAMLKVAEREMPLCEHDVEWLMCDVVDMPYPDGAFDVGFCQQGLQFFPDKPKALAEIRRVLNDGGTLYVTCWQSVSPLFQAASDALRQRVSEKSADQALAPFSFRDGKLIASILTDAGFRVVNASTLSMERPLKPPRDAIREDLLSSPYEQELRDKGDDVIDAVTDDIVSALDSYRREDTIFVPLQAHLFQAQKSD